jgi:hypothetical protein
MQLIFQTKPIDRLEDDRTISHRSLARVVLGLPPKAQRLQSQKRDQNRDESPRYNSGPTILAGSRPPLSHSVPRAKSAMSARGMATAPIAAHSLSPRPIRSRIFIVIPFSAMPESRTPSRCPTPTAARSRTSLPRRPRCCPRRPTPSPRRSGQCQSPAQSIGPKVVARAPALATLGAVVLASSIRRSFIRRVGVASRTSGRAEPWTTDPADRSRCAGSRSGR